jgi:zinc and cadmium transporter
MTLLYIIIFSLLGGVGAVIAAASFLAVGKKYQKRLVSGLVPFATGALLTSALLGLIPHALKDLPADRLLLIVLVGVLLFFILEKLIIWRHCHIQECPEHHKVSGTMILVGDTFHNLADGVIIAASFLVSIPVGIATSLAVIAHEIPQEVGDLGILLHSGYPRKKAFWLNVASSFVALPAAIIAYFALDVAHKVVPYVMALAAASFLYIALADLSPELHRRAETADIIRQLILVLAGVTVVALLLQFSH